MQRIKDLEFLKKFKSDNTLTEEDALRLEGVKQNLLRDTKGLIMDLVID